MRKMHYFLRLFFIGVVLFLFAFCKKEELPRIITDEVTEISTNSAKGKGIIIDPGTSPISISGLCWSKDLDPTIDDFKTSDGPNTGFFHSTLTQLEGGTKYYVKAYAISNVGIAYGNVTFFTTLGEKPAVITEVATDVLTMSAQLNASVNPNFLETTVSFEFGITTTYGNEIAVNPNIVTGNSEVKVSAKISGLIPNTTYHYRIKAQNSLGIVYGDDKTFITRNGDVPSAITITASDVTQNSAIIHALINPNSFYTTVSFEYGTSTDYGLTISGLPNTINADTVPVNISAKITGLNSGTFYHFRIKAENSLGSAYGTDLSFPTLGFKNTTGSFIDARDGTNYKIIKIGSQWWMAENLAYLPIVAPPIDGSDSKPYYYVYGYNGNNVANAKASDNYKIYGVLYNWTAAMNGASDSNAIPSGVKGVCPDGWHLPSSNEWRVLQDYLIGNCFNYDGSLSSMNIAKSIASDYNWNTSTVVGSVGNNDYPEYRNLSGFTGLLCGNRYRDGNFSVNGFSGMWWTTSIYEQFGDNRPYAIFLNYASVNISIMAHNEKQNGFSIRCIKNEN